MIDVRLKKIRMKIIINIFIFSFIKKNSKKGNIK